MDIVSTVLFWAMLARSMIAGIMFVIFGTVTVRKLRKNPQTRRLLGMEYLLGWDILNAAWALSLSRKLRHRSETSAFSALFANSEALYANTTRLGRVLARTQACSHGLAALLLPAWYIASR